MVTGYLRLSAEEIQHVLHSIHIPQVYVYEYALFHFNEEPFSLWQLLCIFHLCFCVFASGGEGVSSWLNLPR